MDNREFNIFNLNGDKITDIRVIELLELTKGTEHTADMNYELLENARKAQVKLYPSEADVINEMFDNAIYWLKVKLAARGMYHDKG